MDEADLLHHIHELIETEHQLRQGEEERPAPDAADRLRTIEVALDQCWDLLRQRRARREFGDNPDDSALRPASTVEGHPQ